MILGALACAGNAAASPPGSGAREVCAVSSSAACAAVPALAGTPATLHVGDESLRRCASSPEVYCGTLSVPLDYALPSGPHISIAYRWYPASNPQGAPAGTVVPVEGGPGYPSIGSVEGGYSVQYGHLLERWNLLAVDNRGTGESTPIECPLLQRFSGPTGGGAFQEAAAACAASLDHRWRSGAGGWVHASDLFTSAVAAEDLASVIEALDAGPVDLYGDSYGTFFAQAFASRFPGLLRSVILDSAYQTSDLDPWYRSTITAMPPAFDAVCARAPACAAAEPEGAWASISSLAERLREQPLSGVVPGPGGRLERVTMNVVGLVDLINDAADDPQVYRDLDAAARALLQVGYAAPLLRLYAQRLFEDEAYFDVSPREYSVGLYLAVSCLDYPQLFAMSAAPSVRAEQLRAATEALPATTFAPFTVAEWLSQDENTEAYTACLQWPAPTIAEPPTTGEEPLFPSTLPVLVLGGELDSWTPPSEVPKVLAQIGGDARFIELANATHVVGEGDTACGSTLIQEFVSDPAALASLDASCAAAVPAIHAVGSYPASIVEAPPLTPSAGNGASIEGLRLAAAAVATAGDAIARYHAIEAPLDRGLAGGVVKAGPQGLTLVLLADELIPGVAVSGTVRLSPAALAAEGELVQARLTARSGTEPPVSLHASWSTLGAGPAEVSGRVGGVALAGSQAAP